MIRALLIAVSLMIGSFAHAQTASVIPNVQTGQVPPAAAAPAEPRHPSAITQPDSGSSIDKPPTVGTEPETGYHAPVIPQHKLAKPLPHEQMREATIPPAINKGCVAAPRTVERKGRRARASGVRLARSSAAPLKPPVAPECREPQQARY